MVSTLVVCIVFISLFLLGILTVIDMKVRLLPNIYVLAFFICGLAFHFLLNFLFLTPLSALIGMIAGGGLLLSVRFAANKYYGQDTLGLGDVKLMGAAGVWLGLEGIFLAITIGAFAGLAHGIIHKMMFERETALAHLSIPAGPGFIVGILSVAIYQFWNLPKILLDLAHGNMLSL